jgi:hypothetical protein
MATVWQWARFEFDRQGGACPECGAALHFDKASWAVDPRGLLSVMWMCPVIDGPTHTPRVYAERFVEFSEDLTVAALGVRPTG